MLEKNKFSLINNTKQKVSKGDFLFVLENFLKKMEIKNPVEVNIIIVGKKRIQKLNFTYRNKNKPTDILSFPIDITKPKKLHPSSYKLILGDIYICPQMVVNNELQSIFLHGLIHLIGYDHEKNKREWERVLNKIENN